MDVDENNAWINTESKDIILNRGRFLSEIGNERNHEIMTLLNLLKIFTTRVPAGIIIAEERSSNEHRSWSPEFQNAVLKGNKGLLIKGAFKNNGVRST